MFEKYNVLSRREMESRMDIYLEHYIKSMNVEAKQTIEMSKTMIFPAAIRYQGELAVTCANLKAVGYTFDTDTLDKVTAMVKELQDSTAALEKVAGHHSHGSLLEEATMLLHESRAGDGGGPQSGRRTGMHRGRRPLAAADIPGNAVYQVAEAQEKYAGTLGTCRELRLIKKGRVFRSMPARCAL